MSSKYSITIYVDPGIPGHFSIGVTGPGITHAVRGYYPKDGEDLVLTKEKTKGATKALHHRANGELRDDVSRINSVNVISAQVELPDKQAAEEVIRHFKDVEANPGNYDLFNKNCINFVQDALDQAGIDQSVADKFDTEELIKMGPAGLEALRDAKIRKTEKVEGDKSLPDLESSRPIEEFRLPGQSSVLDDRSKKSGESAVENLEDGSEAPGSSVAANDRDFWDEDVWDHRATVATKSQTQNSHHPKSHMRPNGFNADKHDQVSIDDMVRRAQAKGIEVSSHRPSLGQANIDLSGKIGDMGNHSGLGRYSHGKALIDKATSASGAVDDILEKHPSQWTAKEVRTIQASDLYGRPGPQQPAVSKAVERWYSRVYGDQPVKYDRTGKMIEAEPKAPVPERSEGARDIHGRSVASGVERVMRHMTHAGGADPKGLESEVRLAQKAFNLTRPHTPLKEDGEFGPKSRRILRMAVQHLGPAKVEEALSLGRFAEFAETARKTGAAAGLASTTERTFGPLFQNRTKRGADWKKTTEARPTMPPVSRPEALALQETVNDLGHGAFGASFEPIKEDGWIGPKTTEVYQSVATATEPFQFTKRFSENLGFSLFPD